MQAQWKRISLRYFLLATLAMILAGVAVSQSCYAAGETKKNKGSVLSQEYVQADSVFDFDFDSGSDSDSTFGFYYDSETEEISQGKDTAGSVLLVSEISAKLMRELLGKVKKDARYRSLREKITASGLTIDDVVNPKASPPVTLTDFSNILHDQLNHFVNALYDWQASCRQKQQLALNGEWLRDINVWDSLKIFLLESDPLLFSGLVHLVHLAHHGLPPLSESSQAYLQLRLEWINEVVLPEKIDPIDWNDAYRTLFEKVQEWKTDEWTSLFKPVSTPLLKIAIEGYLAAAGNNYSSNKIEQEQGDYIWAIRHLTDRELHKSCANLRTAWNTWMVFGRQEMVETFQGDDDVLLKDHAAFIFRALQEGEGYDRVKSALGLAWLQQTAIEHGRATASRNAVWFSKVTGYEMPEPVISVPERHNVYQVNEEPAAKRLKTGPEVKECNVKSARLSEAHFQWDKRQGYNMPVVHSRPSPVQRVAGGGVTLGRPSGTGSPAPPILYITPSPSLSPESVSSLGSGSGSSDKRREAIPEPALQRVFYLPPGMTVPFNSLQYQSVSYNPAGFNRDNFEYIAGRGNAPRSALEPLSILIPADHSHTGNSFPATPWTGANGPHSMLMSRAAQPQPPVKKVHDFMQEANIFERFGWTGMENYSQKAPNH